LSFKRYLKYSTILVLALLIVIGGFDWLIDPYDIFSSPQIAGIIVIKPEIQTHVRLTKAYVEKKSRPQAIVLGTSRAEVGIDPSHPGWSYQPVYNLALSGSNIYEIFRYLQHAENIQPLKQIVLLLDFTSFATDSQNQPDFDEDRLSVNAHGKPNSSINIKDFESGLFSLDAIQSSINTLKQPLVTGYYLPNGFRQYTSLYAKNGYYDLFRSAEQSSADYNPQHYQFDNYSSDNSPFICYRKILQIACQNNIDLRLVIAPYHAKQMELVEAQGSWAQSEKWKWNLVTINEEETLRIGHAPFPLWDFSGINEFTTETVPAPDDKFTQMLWWWDGVHFKKELGDLMLDKVFNKPESKTLIPENFGILINSQNIERNFRSINSGLLSYQNNSQ
jgi:hypothetical protein